MRYSKKTWLLLIISSQLMADSSYRNGSTSGKGCDDLSGLPIFYKVDFNTEIFPLFSNYGCSSCHDGSDGGLNLTTNAGPPLLPLLGAVSFGTGEPFIEPGLPEMSYLFQKVNCQTPFNGIRMPATGDVMTLADQGMIYDWIYQGALGEFPPGLWFRDLIYRSNFESFRN